MQPPVPPQVRGLGVQDVTWCNNDNINGIDIIYQPAEQIAGLVPC